MSDDIDQAYRLNETADKITLKTQVKRGDGTRDQDKIDVKIKGEDPERAVSKLADVLDQLEDMGVADHLRETQPGGDDESS